MRSSCRLASLAATVFAAVFSWGALAAAFTPGNLVIYRVGDGSAALTANATAVFLDEYTTAGALVQSIPLPTAVSGSNRQLTAAGTATSEGLLTRSADGNYILLAGYDAPLGTVSVGGTTGTTINRVVGRADGTGSVDTSTALSDFASGGNPRGAASTNGVDIWVTGSIGGSRYTTFGTVGTSTQLSTSPVNLRATVVTAGQLYISASSGTTRVATVGTGTPTTSGQTITNLPGFPATGSPYQFAFADLDAGVAGNDTVYVCDDTGATTGIQKHSLVAGTWTLNGTLVGQCRGLTISVSGTTVTLYTTRTGSILQVVTDTAGYNAAINGTLSTIATAGTNTAFRGVAFVPVVATPDLSLSVSGPANGVVGVNYDYTLTVTNSGIAATGVAVDFTLPSGVSFVSASGSGFSTSQAAGVVSFTGGSVAASGGQAVLTVTVTPTSPGGVTVPAGAGVADPGNTIVESNEANNATTQVVTTTVTATDPDLTASISGPANAATSTNYDYLITIQNIGNSTASAVAVNFALPSGVTYVGSTTPGGFGATLNGSTVEFTGGSVSVGSPVVLTVTVTAPAAPTTVTVSPGAVVADPLNTIVELSDANNASTETLNTTVTAALQPDLTVSISGPPTGTTYNNYDYTITVANGGSAPATSVRVDFALPPGVTYVGATVAGGFTASPSGSVVQFTGGTIATGGNVVLTVTVKAPSAPTTVTVTPGAVLADPLNTVTEGDEGNNASTGTVATVVSEPANLRKIHEVQGSTNTSPLTGQTVTVDAIVTGHYPGLSGFFLQEEDVDADADPATSEGIFVFNGTTVAVGDRVRVAGTVAEFTSSGITVTELTTVTGVITISTGNTLPTPATVTLPVGAITDLERYEGMRVAFTQTLTVTNTFDLGHFGEVTLSANGRLIQPTNVIDPNDNPASGTTSTGATNVAAVTAAQDLNNRNQILIEDASTASFPGTIQFWDNTQNTLRLGSTADNLAGIMHHAFGSYRVLPQAITWTFAQRPLTPPPVGAANLKVAGMNTLNYFNGDGLGGGFPTSRGADTPAEFNRQRAKTIQAIHQLGADIVGLMEMENDGNGPNSAIQDLVNGLNLVAGAGTWAFVNDPAGYTGLPGGTDLIKPAIIYKTAAVTPVGASLASGDAAFSNGRAPVAQTFQVANGQKVTVVANHFKSKGSGGSGLDLDQNDGQGFFNNSRKNQATALLNFVNTTVIPAAGDPKVILLGDFNAYEQEDPMDILRAGGYTAMAEGITSYSFDAQSGALDHVLVSSALLPRVTGADKWHINADEPTIIDYNVENKLGAPGCVTACTAPDYYSTAPFRVSDHDPVLVGLFLAAAPTAPQNLQGTAGNAQIVLTYLAPASDGGSAVTGYSASCTDGGVNTGSGNSVAAGLTITVGSLVNGVTYSCTVTAANAIGTGPASTAATNLTPSTVPNAPTNVQGTSGNAQIVLTYLAPANNGGSAITGYSASCTDGGVNTGSGNSVGAGLAITVSSLVNGVTYSCTVTAANANGASVPSSAATNLTPSTVPGAPTNVQGTPGNAQIVLTYLAPASNGGAAITGYNASCSDGGSNNGSGSSVGAALTLTVGSLVNGVTYSCTVTAANVRGAGPASTAATGLKPSTVPDPPTGINVTAGNAQASFTYTAPASNGGSPITGYSATCTGGSGATGNSAGAALLIAISSLVNGTTYSCTFVAINANGSSAPSAPVVFTPSTVPGAPTNVQGAAGNTQIVLTYLAPASNGGSAITGYTAQCTDGGVNTGSGSSVGAGLTITVGSLVNGVTYSCTVRAVNANGPGTISSSATNLKPSAVPGAPTNVQGTAGDATATITYQAPASNGGSPITGYTASCTGGSGATGNSVGTALTITLNGLTNGVTYTCTVVANNANGPSVPSASVQVSPQQPSYALTVSKSGAGSGSVTSNPAGINCGATCVGTFANGGTVTLTATPAAGSAFTGWSGACSGTGACVVTMGGDRAVTASFGVASQSLTVTKGGTGAGTVSSTAPATPSIDCGATCSASFAHGTVVTLSATAAAGSTFVGWTGACSGSGGCSVTMDAAKIVTATFDSPPRLSNISSRMQVLTGNDVMIGGFVIGGSVTKRVAIVATGPSLAAFGITNALANPTLRLVRSSDQATIATSDDWQTAPNQAELTAAGFAPSNALEAAILADLAPGAYTAIVEGASGGTGVSVIGVYEVNHPEAPLVNISTRGRVLTGNDVMIGGFVINGTGPQTVAIVATGPSLAQFGITSPLANPTITLVRSSDQAVIATNDDWLADASAAQLQAAGFAPSNALESGLYRTLPPGAYTVIVQGVGGSTGVAVVGIYRVN